MDSNKEINVAKNEKFTELIDNIGNTEISDDIKIDENFEDKLRDYQKVGYKWLKTLEKYKFGGILADDMGLGKTLQIIAVLKSELKNKITSIVVCPSTLVLNWKAEIEKWCDSIKVLIVKGNAEERKEKLYLSYMAQTKKEVAEELNGSSFEKSKFKILMLLTRLRQICCHPSLFIENYKGNSGKLKQCLNLVIDAIESGHKILLFHSLRHIFTLLFLV